jgi:hypothetical protein
MYYDDENTNHYDVGHDDSVSGFEYEEIARIINELHNTDLKPLECRAEFESAYNKIFDRMLLEYPEKVFDILYVIMDEFNIDEIKAVRYLNEKNKSVVRNFAMANCVTDYWQKKEKEAKRTKAHEKGKLYLEHIDTEDLFE